jgi:hypothetical protein
MRLEVVRPRDLGVWSSRAENTARKVARSLSLDKSLGRRQK